MTCRATEAHAPKSFLGNFFQIVAQPSRMVTPSRDDSSNLVPLCHLQGDLYSFRGTYGTKVPSAIHYGRNLSFARALYFSPRLHNPLSNILNILWYSYKPMRVDTT